MKKKEERNFFGEWNEAIKKINLDRKPKQMKKSNKPRKYGSLQTDRITVRVPKRYKDEIKREFYRILKDYERAE